MKKKIAIAVDGSVHCGCAVRYAAAMSEVLPELHFVLLHIQPPLSQYLTEEAERKPKALKALQRLIKSNEDASLKILEKVRDQMVQCGIDTQCIETSTRIRQSSVAEDILDICRTQSYDAVAIGRRGVTRLQELLMGSVAATLLEHSRLTPVWMVDGEVVSNKILLAADGSSNALRALDHLAFMLSGHPDAKIHMVHVQPTLKEVCETDFNIKTMQAAEEVILESDRRCIDDFHKQALDVLAKNGLDASRMELLNLENRFSTAAAIVDAAREGRFGTIVLGRKGFAKSLFTGSVSRKIVQKATDTAVWLVP